MSNITKCWSKKKNNNMEQHLSTKKYNLCEISRLTTLSNCEKRTDSLSQRVQILDLTDCISHSTNTLGKGMNPIILPPAMGK